MAEYFVPTKSCPTGSSHEVYEFETRDKKKNNSIKKDIADTENIEEVIMKNARFEVYKFAQSGLPNAERQKSQFDLALKLGAVPKKNKPINYKKLKEEKQSMKKAEIERKSLTDFKSKQRRKIKDPKKKLRRKRKVGSGILKSYGKIRRS